MLFFPVLSNMILISLPLWEQSYIYFFNSANIIYRHFTPHCHRHTCAATHLPNAKKTQREAATGDVAASRRVSQKTQRVGAAGPPRPQCKFSTFTPSSQHLAAKSRAYGSSPMVRPLASPLPVRHLYRALWDQMMTCESF